ncbi:MAG TPA: DUF1634 domain-containing protein [Puia sp.]|jgi:uncharacterized membrane protein|nr:DUF1634 domain-containing protein [Puia sp.]
MPLFKRRIQDADLESIIGQLLRYGVLISSLVVAAGGVVYLYRHGTEPPLYRQFKGEPSKMRELRPLWEAVLRGEGRPLIQLGLLILVATPIARILFSIFGYLVEKDYLYVVITLVVLTVILWNF